MAPTNLARRFSSRFFLAIAQKSPRRWRDECTMNLFTLPMILEAERTLAADAVRVLEAKRD